VRDFFRGVKTFAAYGYSIGIHNSTPILLLSLSVAIMPSIQDLQRNMGKMLSEHMRKNP
jgi:hypothetical protein